MALIEVDHLVKDFIRYRNNASPIGMLGSFFKQERTKKRAVDDVSFSIDRGEMVGYIGPNGAGKSTTIKMLTGILTPTSGEIRVNGIIPYMKRKQNAMSIGVMFGQRSQLWWDLPPAETYDLLRHMYKVDKAQYSNTLRLLTEHLGLHEFWGISVRQLSLGQRMRAELGAALIHRPQILYLDEPTIGMDMTTIEQIRKFLKDMNTQYKTTIILTTHKLDEVEKLCSRIIVINYGKVLFDGTISELRSRCSAESILTVEFEEYPDLTGFGSLPVYEIRDKSVSFTFNRNTTSASRLIQDIVKNSRIKDISIKDPPIDAFIRELYEKSSTEGDQL